jgi:pSer/pThr/pTyr-binding forkhead associated (FHA) protein
LNELLPLLGLKLHIPSSRTDISPAIDNTCIKLLEETLMKLQVVVREGANRGRVFKLVDGQSLTIGRGKDTDTALDDVSTSRRHCKITAEDGKVVLTDTGSASGTFVNGKKVSEATLAVGDLITVGDTVLLLRDHQLMDGQSIGLASLTADEVAAEAKQSNDAKIASGSEAAAEPKEFAQAKDPADEWIGKTVHRYKISKLIANGSTGTVYLADFAEKNEEVALKVFDLDASRDSDDMQRFVRGMKTMFPIRHPNIVRIYNAGETDGRCWVAMEYVDGENLSDIIERTGTLGMMDWPDAFKVTVGIARALEAAGEHQIIHRNITPQNILVRKSDKVAKLGDLMLAKALDGAQAKQITAAGDLVGDISYMSPERVASLDNVDCRSDIYSLGATVYALLTGRPPFESKSLPSLMMKIRDEDPPSPKQFQLSINDMFEGVVLRMLAKRPDDRFQTPTELLRDLERIGKFNSIQF